MNKTQNLLRCYMVVMVFCQMSIQISLTGIKRARFIQTTACIPREVCLILRVEYSQFFAFHLSLCTSGTTFSSRLMFSFEFFSPKDFCNSSIIKTNWLFTLNATKWRYFLPFTFPFYSTSNIREKIFNHQEKKKKESKDFLAASITWATPFLCHSRMTSTQ